MSIIKKLQNKPRYIRIQVLWISVILIMVIISSLWLFFLNRSLGASKTEKKSVEKENSVPSLFNTLKEDFSLLKDKLEAGIQSVSGNNQEQNLETETMLPKPNRLPEE